MDFMLKDPQGREICCYTHVIDKNAKVQGDRQVCLKLCSQKMTEERKDIHGALFLLYSIMYSS